MTDVPISDKVSASFRQLSEAATHLNAVSDELGRSIVALDAALKRLNLGISSWIKIGGYENDETGYFRARYLGYGKVRSQWGIALSTVEGNHYSGDTYDEDEWLFNDAPRELRIEAVDRLPELLDKLIAEANDAAEKIKAKVGPTQEVVAAVTATASQMAPQPARRK